MHTQPLQAFMVHAQQNMQANLLSLKAVSIHLYKAKFEMQETDKLETGPAWLLHQLVQPLMCLHTCCSANVGWTEGLLAIFMHLLVHIMQHNVILKASPL
jgi:hypothetical protein